MRIMQIQVLLIFVITWEYFLLSLKLYIAFFKLPRVNEEYRFSLTFQEVADFLEEKADINLEDLYIHDPDFELDKPLDQYAHLFLARIGIEEKDSKVKETKS